MFCNMELETVSAFGSTPCTATIRKEIVISFIASSENVITHQMFWLSYIVSRIHLYVFISTLCILRTIKVIDFQQTLT